jgi:hypothetical protein
MIRFQHFILQRTFARSSVLAALAALVLTAAHASAQVVEWRADPHGRMPASMSTTNDAMMSVVIDGPVVDVSGAPLIGAPSVDSTVVTNAGGTNAGSSERVTPSVSGTSNVGAPTLQAVGGCQPSWIPTFGGQPGTNAQVCAQCVFDDGSGPALYVGGDFTSAGGAAANHIARWNGSTWSELGSGTSAQRVVALTVFDDGSGPALYAGGWFATAGGVAANGIAKWNGSTWSTLGSGMSGVLNSQVAALVVFDDGDGAALYAGGAFTTAGGVPANNIARWNGLTWSALGSGMNDPVSALTAFDDGNGPALYASTKHWTGSGYTATVAKWNGSSWSQLGSGMNQLVSSLTVFNNGSGPALYAGGAFTTAGGVAANRIAKWNGSSWSAFGSGMNSYVSLLTVLDDGSGPVLYAGGSFTTAGGSAANSIAKWSGSSWLALGSGLGINSPSFPSILALTMFDSGSGPALYAGGEFLTAGGVIAPCIAKWSASTWSALGSGISSSVEALTEFDDGSGPALYAGGAFLAAGGVAANSIAKWNGANWSALSTGVSGPSYDVSALTVFDDGSGPALYAGGGFTGAGGFPASRVAKWDGASWSALGSGLNSTTFASSVRALTVFDDGNGSALYAGGAFLTAGSVSAIRVAKWDGTNWSALGSGLSNYVYALTVFDDGNGPALYAGGEFTTAGGVAANHIAKWNGSNWSALGSGTNGQVYGLTVFDDGSGPALYAGGFFTVAGGVAINRIARWNGSSWSALGSGTNSYVTALAVFDDGSGPALHVGGAFTVAGGVAANRIAKWNGSSWSALGSGVNDYPVMALTTFDDGSGTALYAGGTFGSAFDSGDSYLAKWGCPHSSSGTPYCTAGTTTNGCVSAISGFGNASASAASGFTIAVSNVEGQKSGLIFYGVTGPNSAPWAPASTSFLCVKPPTQRTSSQNSGGTIGVCDGTLSIDWNAYLASHAGALGQPFAGGETVWAQGWFRDPPAPKTTNLSDGLTFTVAP